MEDERLELAVQIAEAEERMAMQERLAEEEKLAAERQMAEQAAAEPHSTTTKQKFEEDGMLDTVKSWLRQITEVGLLLIAAAVVLEIIFGSAVPYIGVGILDNIIALTAKLGQDGLVGIIAIGIIVWLYLRR